MKTIVWILPGNRKYLFSPETSAGYRNMLEGGVKTADGVELHNTGISSSDTKRGEGGGRGGGGRDLTI